MRRAGLLVLVLASLSLTTAFAASFDVQAEDITSFSAPADIATPTTKRLYLIDPAPSRLAETPESNAANVHSKSLVPGGVLAEPGGALGTNTDPARYHDWLSDPMPAAVTIVSPTVELYITQTGADGVLTAGLFDCDDTGCSLIPNASESGEPDKNLVVITFPAFEHLVDAGNRLLLRVVNTDTQAYNIQWGYKENRPARLVLDLVASG